MSKLDVSDLLASEVPLEGSRFRRIVFTDRDGFLVFEFSLRPSNPTEDAEAALQQFVDAVLQQYKQE